MANKRIKGIKENPLDIVKSTIKRVVGSANTEVERKLAICDPCENKVQDKVFGGSMCDLCFCNLKTLVHSKKGCQLNKW